VKGIIPALLLFSIVAFADDTNSPARIKPGETWSSQSRLERIARHYANKQKIDFSFEKTRSHVWLEKRGTNSVATIYFSSGMGAPTLVVEIAPDGNVITNLVGVAACGNAVR
jgi:hypothetical protein